MSQQARSLGLDARRSDHRLEWYNPAAILDDLVEQASDEHRPRVELIMQAYTGQLGNDVSPNARKLAGWLITAENYLTLLFSALASVPDFAGTLIRTREVKAAAKAFSTQFKAITRDDARERARLMGLTLSKISHHAINEYYGQTFFSEKQQKANALLFKWNLQEALDQRHAGWLAGRGRGFPGDPRPPCDRGGYAVAALPQ